MRDAMTQRRALAVLLVDVIRVEVAGDAREQVHVRLADGLAEPRAEPDLDVLDAGASHIHHQSLPALRPPSTKMVWPVMNRAPSEARKTARGAMSSGSPMRRSGVLAMAASTRCGLASM